MLKGYIVILCLLMAPQVAAQDRDIPSLRSNMGSPNTAVVANQTPTISAIEDIDPVKLSKRAFLLSELVSSDSSSRVKSDYLKIMDIVIGRSSRPDDKNIEAMVRRLSLSHETAGPLLKKFFELEKVLLEDLAHHKAYGELVSMQNSDLWGEKYLSSLLLSVLHLKGRDVLPGLEKANLALEAIPTDIDPQVRLAALYDTYTVLNNGLILDKSLDQALDVTARLLTMATEMNESPDAFSISNNLAVLYSYGNRPDIAIEILKTGEMYLESARHDQRVLFLNTMGHLLNKNGDYQASEPYLKEALSDSPTIAYLPFIYSNLAESYSHTGSVVEAKALLDLIEELREDMAFSDVLDNSSILDDSILKLKYTIASTEGQYEDAFHHLKSWSDRRVKALNSEVYLNRQEASKKLSLTASLSNQRLESLEVEASLKDTIIEREKNIRIFITVIGALVLLVSFMLMYLVHSLRKSNRIISRARDEAVKGEKAKSDFLSMMSHEVRTPLNAIIPLADQLISRSKDNSDKRLLSIMKSAGESMLFMMENIILFTSKETLNPEYFIELDIHDVMKASVGPFAQDIKDKELKLTAKNKVSDRRLVCNRRALTMILGNIISNAVKFTKEGEIDVEYQGNAKSISVVIRDNGEGFDVAHLDELLQPFVQADNSITRKFGGVGIGLAATHELVTQLNGSMEIDSTIGQGTKVTITIPRGQPLVRAIAA